jgi:hypothetical protein
MLSDTSEAKRHFADFTSNILEENASNRTPLFEFRTIDGDNRLLKASMSLAGRLTGWACLYGLLIHFSSGRQMLSLEIPTSLQGDIHSGFPFWF